MNSSLFDPNNHAPELTPDDDWGDAAGAEKQPGMPAILPVRRTISHRAAPAAPAPDEEPALRIEPNLNREQTPDAPSRLEVQEISSQVVRLDQSLPVPPKVEAQITFHERPVHESTRKKSRGEGGEWGRASRRPVLWVLGSGVLVAVLVVSGMAVLPAINAKNAPRAVEPVAAAVREEVSPAMQALNRLLVKQPEAMQIFRTYMTAAHPDEFIPLLRKDGVDRATLLGRWQAAGISPSWQPAADSGWSVVEISGHACGILHGALPDHTNFSAYFTAAGDRLELDWKATTGFGTASFAELGEGTGDPAEIRGEISPTEFYSAVWPEEEYQSYRLLAPDGDTAIWCYARRDSAANGAISPLFLRGDIVQEAASSRKITLRLEPGRDGALPNQYRIAELLHLDWVAP